MYERGFLLRLSQHGLIAFGKRFVGQQIGSVALRVPEGHLVAPPGNLGMFQRLKIERGHYGDVPLDGVTFIVLGVIVSLYGMRQTPDEIKRLMESDPDYAQRYITSFYASKEGEGQMRVFSTFVSAAAFGSTVANVVISAVALMSATETSRREKRLIMLAILPMVYGMVLSGSRTSLITLGVGLARLF